MVGPRFQDRLRLAGIDPTAQLPGRDVLQKIISTCYQASLLLEEDRQVRFRLIIREPNLLPADEGPPTGRHRLRFCNPRPFNEYELHRLAPAADFYRTLLLTPLSGLITTAACIAPLSMLYFYSEEFRILGQEAGDMTEQNESGKGIRAKKTATEKVKFEFTAPDAQEVFLAGDFNNWDICTNPMKRDKKGVWKATLSLAPGRYEYRFLADGEWENDPSCCCVSNQFGSMNCVRTVEKRSDVTIKENASHLSGLDKGELCTEK